MSENQVLGKSRIILRTCPPKKGGLVIGPHTRGQTGVLPFMAGYYIEIGIVVGIVVGAEVASVVWIVVSQVRPDTHIAQIIEGPEIVATKAPHTV